MLLIILSVVLVVLVLGVVLVIANEVVTWFNQRTCVLQRESGASRHARVRPHTLQLTVCSGLQNILHGAVQLPGGRELAFNKYF